MFNLQKFIADSVTYRPVSMFATDIEANKETLIAEIKDKKVCVIGGAGSIGSSFIKAVLRFEPASVVVIDLNENGLAELVTYVQPKVFTYPMSFVVTPSTLQILFSSAFSVRKKASISLPTSLLTSMYVQRKTSTLFRHSLKITTSRLRN